MEANAEIFRSQRKHAERLAKKHDKNAKKFAVNLKMVDNYLSGIDFAVLQE